MIKLLFSAPLVAQDEERDKPATTEDSDSDVTTPESNNNQTQTTTMRSGGIVTKLHWLLRDVIAIARLIFM